MFLSSLIEDLCTKEENNKAGYTLTFGGQCIFRLQSKVSKYANFHKNRFINDRRKKDHPLSLLRNICKKL